MATTLIGVLDECIQALLPSRLFDPRDMLFNVLAAVMAMLEILALRWVRRYGSSSLSLRNKLAGFAVVGN